MPSSHFGLLLNCGIFMFFVYTLQRAGEIRINANGDKVFDHLEKLRQYGNVTPDNSVDLLSRNQKKGLYFFTIWTFILQIAFLFVAIIDDVTKLTGNSKVQKQIEKVRLLFFSTLVLPCSVLVVTFFWTVWHIDRELIFPRAVDEYYHSWMNHTLHTFIIVPVFVEILTQFRNERFRVTRKKAALILGIYCLIYQSIYLSVYITYGVWLYPVYKVLNWTQRVGLTLGQFGFALLYQQVGISLLKNDRSKLKSN